MANNKSTSSDKAKERMDKRYKLGESKPISIPPMPAWKINALNQIGEDTLRQVLDKLETNNRAMVIRPTGFGKSYMLAGLTSCGKFKKCLYIYPTAVIKTDMLDTYGVYGEDNRACKLKNTTFITYTMLGKIVKQLGIRLEESDLDDEYLVELKYSQVNTYNNEEESDGTSLTLRKLAGEDEVYDTAPVNWHNKLVKNKREKIKGYKDIVEQYTNDKTNLLTELNELENKKSKAYQKMNKLRSEIIDLESKIEHYNNIINTFKNRIKAAEAKTEVDLNISSVSDLKTWLSSFDIIIIDEAHRTGAVSFISLWQCVLRDLVVNEEAGHKIKMVGATATPYRLDGKSLEHYIFGDNSRLKSITINDCIKANNWEYLGIDLNIIMQDDVVINEGTTIEYLQSRGLFKKIDYVYVIHDKGQFTNDVIDYLDKCRKTGNKFTDDQKDKMIKAANTPESFRMAQERSFCKLNTDEQREWSKKGSKRTDRIKKYVSDGMTAKEKEIALELCDKIQNETERNIFKKRVRYELTLEDIKYLISEIKNKRNLDSDILKIISKEADHLQPSECKYIQSKIEQHPSISELLSYSITPENTYGLNYMKFIIFFASSKELNDYIAMGRNSRTQVYKWFSEAFKGFKIHETALHTGQGTKAIEVIKPSDLNLLKPTEGVIDLIYCVDMLNMGYHVENITGVILLRNTESASVYNQQIGRCCSVRAENNTIMIDIIDKKPIGDIIEQVKSSYEEKDLGTDGKQRDIKHLLNSDCINVCDFNKTLIEMIDNMRDMMFTDREIIRFLYFERMAPLDVIIHMTGMDSVTATELLEELNVEMTQLNKVKHIN